MGFKLPGIRAKNQPPSKAAPSPAPAQKAGQPAPSRPFPDNPDDFSVSFQAHNPDYESTRGASPGSFNVTRTGGGKYRMTQSYERTANTPAERSQYGFGGFVPETRDWGEFDEGDISHDPKTGVLSAWNRQSGNLSISTHKATIENDNRPRVGNTPTTEFPSWLQHVSAPGGWGRQRDKINQLR